MKVIGSRRRFLIKGAAALISVGFRSPARASLQSAPLPSDLASGIHALKPGQYLWAPMASPMGPMLSVISLTSQRCYVYRSGVLVGVTTVSTGKNGHQTPTGVFTILQKQVQHKSNLDDSAPMPYMERLTWSGVAMHAGHLPGYPASHGCVRMPLDFAKLLYSVTERGMTVVITDLDEISRVAPIPALLGGIAECDSDGTGKAF